MSAMMVDQVTETKRSQGVDSAAKFRLIDCDVHHNVPDSSALFPSVIDKPDHQVKSCTVAGP